MANPRSDASPLNERFSLDDVINGLAGDLNMLRAGAISTEDARVRAEMAKQIMNGIRLVISAQKYLERNLPPAVNGPTSSTGEKNDER